MFVGCDFFDGENCYDYIGNYIDYGFVVIDEDFVDNVVYDLGVGIGGCGNVGYEDKG